ncbi:MAG: murein L,D-transpeptidase [Hyphomicrobiales bacterium]|nr:murein L,D-transpeptidase [Hyphomicrobiales bacterium]
MNLIGKIRSSWMHIAAGLVMATSLAACNSQSVSDSRAYMAIPPATLAKMKAIGTSPAAPMLIRTYKKESVFEVWKQKTDGRYALLKSFPMCRWSGQLGPKKAEGDRQVPEGFYTIAPGQMNPHSHYYLSFNVGYPNAFDRAWGRTGSSIMVHGICSSAGCFSMTNKQIGEIYALAREAFAGGQKRIQMESFPFRMTAKNLARYRLDPNMPFWKELKAGDEHFAATKTPPHVAVCGRKYVFDKKPVDPSSRLDAGDPCPKLSEDPAIKSAVAQIRKADDQAVALLVAQGTPAVRDVYADGSQNKVFAGRYNDVSRPDALVTGGIEVPVVGPKAPANALKDKPGVLYAAYVAEQKAAQARRLAIAMAASAPPRPRQANVTVLASGTTPAHAGKGQPFYAHWFGLGAHKKPKPSLATYIPATPIPADVPLPPQRRTAARTKAARNHADKQAMLGHWPKAWPSVSPQARADYK